MKKIIFAAIGMMSFNAMAGALGVPDDEKASEFFKRTFKDHNANSIAFNQEGSAKDARVLTLEGEFGILGTRGNTHTSLYKMALDAEHDLPRWFNQYYLQVLRRVTKVDEREIQTSRLQLALEFDYKLPTIKNRLFAFAEYDDNQFVELRDQLTAVVGWRHLWIENQDMTFGYSVGPGYASSRQAKTGDSFEGLLLRSSADFTYTFENDARVRQAITAEVNDEATSINSITSATAKIFNDIALKFSFEISKDENVASNIDDFSTQTSISLVYQFF